MSLFQFGVTRSSGTQADAVSEGNSSLLHSSLPTQSESGLGRSEYELVAKVVSNELESNQVKRRRGKGTTYTTYTAEQRAKIGRYALENGNERARLHYLAEHPNLKESTVRSFKKAYVQELQKRKRKGNLEPVVAVQCKPKGRPPILQDLDGKLIKFLNALRVKGGVVNIHVVRAVTKALIESNSSFSTLQTFSMPRSWVQSLYRRMGCSIRAGTTARPPVPQGLYDEC